MNIGADVGSLQPPAQALLAVARSNALAGLRLGQVLNVRLLEANGDSLLLDMAGAKVSARGPAGLPDGALLRVQVHGIGPSVLLKVIPEGGQRAAVAAQALQNEFASTLLRLTSDQGLVLLRGTDLARFSESLHAGLQRFAFGPESSATQYLGWLLAIIDNAIGGRRDSMARRLRELAVKLIRRKENSEDAETGALRKLLGDVQKLERGLRGLARLNSDSLRRGRDLYLPLPFAGNAGEGMELFIHPDREGDARTAAGFAGFTLCGELGGLGRIELGCMLSGRTAMVSVKSANADVARFLCDRARELEGLLGQAGLECSLRITAVEPDEFQAGLLRSALFGGASKVEARV